MEGMNVPPLTVRASAKLNLTLTVTARRPDGYHVLDSLFVFCGLADQITVTEADTLELAAISGPFGGHVERGADNLLIKAAVLLRTEAGVDRGARITLDKRIPVAAGLGGGSADAAAMLRALNRVWGLDWPVERLETLSAALGADVPACVRSQPVFARGIGDVLSPAPAMPECGILLVNPGLPTPTPSVFKAFREQKPIVPKQRRKPVATGFPSLRALVSAIAPRGNDLLPAAVSVTPVIADVLDAMRRLPDAAYASLSGSGATCFALFATEAQAAAAAQRIADKQQGWWSWSGCWAQ
jgi:4-diphosphocytidyl-2-C-methyl-D-erythritol kinase